VNALPLVTRELHAALRRPSLRWLKLAFAGGGMGGVIWGMLVWTGTSAGIGEIFFRALVLAAAASCTVAALFSASDSIAREKREDTLRFLFLSNLAARDVVAGKFAASALVPGSLMLAVLPPLAMCAVAGNIPAATFIRSVAGLFGGLVLALAICLRVSAQCLHQRTAQGVSAVLLLIANPAIVALAGTFDIPFLTTFFWFGLAQVFVLSFICLERAARQIDANWRDSGSGTAGETSRAAQRPSIAETNPLAWLWASRLVRPRTRLFIGALFLALMLIGVAVFRVFPFFEAALALLFALQLGYQLVTLTRVAYAFQQDRQEGALELLLGTPLEIEHVFNAFRTALLHSSRPALLTLTALNLTAAAILFFVRPPAYALLPLAMTAALWITFLCSGWVTLFHSLMSDYPVRAILSGFVKVTIVPGALAAFFLLAPKPDIPKILVLWVFATLFVGAFFSLDARAALLKHGRELLLRPFAEKPPHIENEWSCMNWEEDTLPRPQTASA
jgi:hypothetical protein